MHGDRYVQNHMSNKYPGTWIHAKPILKLQLQFHLCWNIKKVQRPKGVREYPPLAKEMPMLKKEPKITKHLRALKKKKSWSCTNPSIKYQICSVCRLLHLPQWGPHFWAPSLGGRWNPDAQYAEPRRGLDWVGEKAGILFLQQKL